MSMRILLVTRASSGRFPRWGYLDKFGANEYLARAFALTVAIVAALELGFEFWPHTGPTKPIPKPSFPFAPEVSPTPPPSIIPRQTSPPAVRANIVKSRVNPRPVPGPIDLIDPGLTNAGSGSGTGSESGTEGEDSPADGDWTSEVSEVQPVWPSPDDLIVVEHEPQLVSMQMPDYPEIARLARIEGTVLVRVLVDTEGFVRDTRVLQSVLGLDEAAVDAASTAVFRPARQQDRPVAVWVVVPIEFRLHD